MGGRMKKKVVNEPDEMQRALNAWSEYYQRKYRYSSPWGYTIRGPKLNIWMPHPKEVEPCCKLMRFVMPPVSRPWLFKHHCRGLTHIAMRHKVSKGMMKKTKTLYLLQNSSQIAEWKAAWKQHLVEYKEYQERVAKIHADKESVNRLVQLAS
jgi:hypothetical protein